MNRAIKLLIKFAIFYAFREATKRATQATLVKLAENTVQNMIEIAKAPEQFDIKNDTLLDKIIGFIYN